MRNEVRACFLFPSGTALCGDMMQYKTDRVHAYGSSNGLFKLLFKEEQRHFY
jgi:hypothetical protein